MKHKVMLSTGAVVLAGFLMVVFLTREYEMAFASVGILLVAMIVAAVFLIPILNLYKRGMRGHLIKK